jgi:putative oxidoreductase
VDFRFLEKYEPQLLAILRIVAGLLFLEHATVKFFSFPVPFPRPAPLPTLLLAAGVIELVAGLLVTIGLFTRFAALLASGEMAVAYWTQHFPHNPWPIANQGEAAILFCFAFLFIVAAGPGAWSIDGARTRNGPIR